MKRRDWLLGSTVGLSARTRAITAAATEPLELGTRRELLVDDFLIESLRGGASLRLQTPRDEGIALKFDAPWEGPFSGYTTIIHDGTGYRAYYRGNPTAGRDGTPTEVTCLAESREGRVWTKPNLRQFEVSGTRDNNVVLANQAPFSHNFCPLLDSRAGVAAGERWKALSGISRSGLVAWVSADGLHWRKLREAPVFTQGAFDSQNVSFWSEHERQYLCYFRVFQDGIRRIARTTSPDFIQWSSPVLMEYGERPMEHLYTNQTHPYFRAPHLYVGVAARFFPGRRVLTAEQARGIGVHPSYFSDCSDAVLLSTRGGNRYHRIFMEGFLRPGLGIENWVSRTNYPALNVVPTGPTEMSLYVNQNYGQPTAHLRRYALRLDGFAALHAPYGAGEMLTRPLRCAGRKLTVNFATSAAGSVRVEVQDAGGSAIPGFSLDESIETIGNDLERDLLWKSGSDLGTLTGRIVRLRLVLKDAELFSLRFA